jgi:hypothetical protein
MSTAGPFGARSKGWSRPTMPSSTPHGRQHGAAFLAGRFVEELEVLRDGPDLHLASFCLADAELRLAGEDDPAFAALD